MEISMEVPQKTKNRARLHPCNPNYSEGRDQEDHSSKPAPGK
jgi:hypothetical protein